MDGIGRLVLTLALLGAAQPAAAAYRAAVEGTTLRIVGNKKSVPLRLVLLAGAPGTLAVDVGDDGIPDATFDRATFDAISVEAGGGNDTVILDASAGAFTDTEATTVDGQDGNDHLIGSNAAETFFGGRGDDLVDAGFGDDLVFLGEGDDVAEWRPGGDNDTVEGQEGHDVLAVFGAAVAENFDVAAVGERLRLLRNVANVLLDLNDLEEIDLFAAGGADNVTINDLTGTDATDLLVDLAQTPGGVGSDGEMDAVIVTPAPGTESLDVAAEGTALIVAGLPWRVAVDRGEIVYDHLAIAGGAGAVVNLNGTDGDDVGGIAPAPTPGAVRAFFVSYPIGVDVSVPLALAMNGLGGADTIAGNNGLAGLAVPLAIRGGKGDDVLTGGDGADEIFGESGRDVVKGGRGNDTLRLGSGSDRAEWGPGDGNDTIEGESGKDVLAFLGSNVAENIDVAPNGRRLRFFRNVANVTMDVDGVEQVDFIALGGADTIVVADLAATAVRRLNLDLAASIGGGDAQADAIVVNGTAKADRIKLRADATGVVVARPRAEIRITAAEPASDTLTVNGLAGADKFQISPSILSAIGLTVNED
jgi:Ca2+-binding RTX toxin-like protein